MTLAHKLTVTFSSILLIVVFSSIFIYQKTVDVKTMREYLSDHVLPMVRSLGVIETELQTSLALLRGYMLLGNIETESKYFIAKRAKSWRIIDRQTTRLSEMKLSGRIAISLDELNAQLKQFREIQYEIENIAWSRENTLSKDLFTNSFKPSSQNLQESLSTLINTNKVPQQASIQLANLRYITTLIETQLGYYLSGDFDGGESELYSKLSEFSSVIDSIDTSYQSTMGSSASWLNILRLKDIYVDSAKNIVAERNKKNWNKAQFILTNRAIPLVNDINLTVDELDQMMSIQEEEHVTALFDAENAILNIIWVTTLVAILLSLFVALGFSRFLTRSIGAIQHKSEELAQGFLDGERLTLSSNDELHELSTAVNTVSDNLKAILAKAQLMAQGELDVEFSQRSDRDLIARTLSDMRLSFKQVEQQANQIAKHNYNIDIQQRGPKDRLSSALRDMLESLQRSEMENRAQSWIKNGLNQLNVELRSIDKAAVLAEASIHYLASYTKACVGGIYLVEEDKCQLQASYAFDNRKQSTHTFEVGEGLVGQVMKEKKIVTFSPVPEGYIEVCSGLGKAQPTEIIFLPLLIEEDLKGIIEIAYSEKQDEVIQEFLAQSSESIAVMLNILQARQKVDELLEKTQKQSCLLEEQTQTLQSTQADLERKQDKLEQSNVDLEQKTVELEQKKEELELRNLKLNTLKAELEARADELQLASKYKSEFLANMSHELRTPLNSLLLLAKGLMNNESGQLTDEDVESATIIHQSGNDLLSLINEILDLSKIEAGKLEIIKEEFSVNLLLENMKRMFTPVANGKNIHFEINDHCQGALINSDRKRVEQVLKNLLSNAIKFTSEGKVTLSTEQITLEDMGDALEFTVRDTGIGISTSKLSLIFEAFQQEDGSTSRKFGGTGLGLTISRQLTELLGGLISVDSEVGTGSTFKLILPFNGRASNVDIRSSKQQHSSVSDNLEDISRKIGEESTSMLAGEQAGSVLESNEGMTKTEQAVEVPSKAEKVILVIEDNVQLAKIIAQMVAKQGFNSALAHSAADGFKLAVSMLPDGILLDVGLPDEDGVRLLERLKRHPETMRIPVEIITGLEINVENVLQLGALGITNKPLKDDDIERLANQISVENQQHVMQLLMIASLVELKRLQTVFEQQNVALESCHDITTACKLFKEIKPHLILIDVTSIRSEQLMKLFDAILEYDIPPKVLLYNAQSPEVLSQQLKAYQGHFVVSEDAQEAHLIQLTTLFMHRLESELPEMQRELLYQYQHNTNSLKGKKVLLVDDDMRNTFALAKVLNKEGIEVSKACNGAEALELMTEQEFDLVMMDIMMPVMDGYEAIAKIRENDKWQTVPIIAVTAKAMATERVKCIDVGANDFISKPVDSKRLMSVLHVWLR
ncbi:response regulator [Pseudoalteromonas piscicida]|uniref:response regulator n=1 Tax=Pseudoalteromonas piscicida TaxID=43662 RepID=UPI0032C166D2